MFLQITLGIIISSTIGWLAYRKGALSGSGVVGAILTGTAIFGGGGWDWGMLLITFFMLASLISKYQHRAKAALAEKFAKGSRRDLGQALANGGAGALLALGFGVWPAPLLFYAFIGALATVNADTWATELGVLSKTPPRLITTGKIVEPGTSGGISWRGTLATLVGGTVMGVAAWGFLVIRCQFSVLHSPLTCALLPTSYLWLLATVGGLGGSLCDSLLGATVQAIYYSSVRQKETEKVIDPDGTPNQHLRGWRWLNNDWVNFISSWVGAGIGALIGFALKYGIL